MPRPRVAASPLPPAALWIDQSPQILETVGSDQASGHQFPKAILYLARQAPGRADQIIEERRSALLERREHVARRVREGGRLTLGRWQQVRRIFAKEDRERRNARGSNAAAAFRFERWMR